MTDRVREHPEALFAMGGAVASTSGPVLGGLLSMMTWRLIFAVNVPVGAVALVLVAWTGRSPRRTCRSTGPDS